MMHFRHSVSVTRMFSALADEIHDLPFQNSHQPAAL